jgi:hypothetical protein
MSIPGTKQARSAQATDRGRRSLFWKLGAGVSAALASTTGLARAGTDDGDGTARQAALLADELALRKLHQAYESAMDKGMYEDVVRLFCDDAEVVFDGRTVQGRAHGVSRLYLGQFRAGGTGKRMEPAPGFEVDAGQQRESVEVSADRLTAKAVFPYSIQVGMPIETESSLAGMARLHGEGVYRWWEGGVYDINYVKRQDGRWTIRRLEYRTLSRADYRPGRSYARAMPV